jgi:hypothetical protein
MNKQELIGLVIENYKKYISQLSEEELLALMDEKLHFSGGRGRRIKQLLPPPKKGSTGTTGSTGIGIATP